MSNRMRPGNLNQTLVHALNQFGLHLSRTTIISFGAKPLSNLHAKLRLALRPRRNVFIVMYSYSFLWRPNISP